MKKFYVGACFYNTYSRKSPLAGVFLSAALFSLFHMNLNQIPYAFFVGLVFAFMLEGADSILVTMVMHFAINGYSTVVNYLAGKAGTLNVSSQTDMIESYMRQPQLFTTILTVMGVWALICCAILVGIIYATFKINGRDFRMIFGKRDHLLTEDSEHGSFLDLWLIGFVGLTILLTVLNYMVTRI